VISGVCVGTAVDVGVGTAGCVGVGVGTDSAGCVGTAVGVMPGAGVGTVSAGGKISDWLLTHFVISACDTSPSNRLQKRHDAFPLVTAFSVLTAFLIPLLPDVQNGITVLPEKL